MRRAILVMFLAASAASDFVGARASTLDYATVGRIRDEGLTRSQVAGPRLVTE